MSRVEFAALACVVLNFTLVYTVIQNKVRNLLYLRAYKKPFGLEPRKKSKLYFVYITTNPGRTTLYIGMTNNLRSRIIQHQQNKGNPKTFAGRYYCYKLIYYETYKTAYKAIEREKELKGWNRKKKEELINSVNPD